MQFPVAREHAGMRLDRFIQNRIPRLSRTRANRVVKTCAFRADGTPRRPSQRVKAGEIVWIVRPPMDEPKVPLYFGVIHDDGQVLVIDKPPGLPMHPTATYYKHTLSFLLLTEYPHRSPQFAHRLDRETSGLVICGWDRDAEIVLKKQFERRNVQKTYLAIVEGVMEEDEGMMVQSMAPVEEGLHIMMELREDGLKAQTHYVVRGRAENSTLVELHPRTGRQHQLRVHLAGIGHPIVGDKLYGPGGPETFLQAIGGDRSQELLKRLGHPRQALHAHRLSIGHPAGHEVEYEAPLSADLVQLWENRQQGVMTPVSFESLEERL